MNDVVIIAIGQMLFALDGGRLVGMAVLAADDDCHLRLVTDAHQRRMAQKVCNKRRQRARVQEAA